MPSLGRVVAALALALAVLACAPDPTDSRYSVVVMGFQPDRKIPAIKAIRAETGLGLAAAKRMVEETPATALSGLTRSEAETVSARLRSQGVIVELR